MKIKRIIKKKNYCYVHKKEKNVKIRKNGWKYSYCEICESEKNKNTHAKRKLENPPVEYVRPESAYFCDIHQKPKDMVEKNGYPRCRECRREQGKLRRIKNPPKSRAKGLPMGRPKKEILFCEKHNCVKDALNSNGYRICIYCSRETNRRAYYKNHEQSLIKSKKNIED